MSQSILILGESGTGKSSSIRNLPPEETVIINVIGKPLPFRGALKNYTRISPEGLSGNYYDTDNHLKIMKLIDLVNNRRLDIKNLIIDDFGYTMTNSFMRKAHMKGYDKFVEIGKDAFDLVDALCNLRDDLFCFVMMHTEIDNQGRYKPRTVGKMTDQYNCIEGRFTYVYHALVSEGRYQFLTNNDGQHMSKTPMGLHEEMYIDNDLFHVKQSILEYFNDDKEEL